MNYFYKLYDWELGCIGRYSSKVKANQAERRFENDTDGDCSTRIDKKELPIGKTVKNIDIDLW